MTHAPTSVARRSRAALAVAGLTAASACSKEAPAPAPVASAVPAPAAPKPLKVAAAADLAFAFAEVGDAFAKAPGGVKPTFTFGSTGLLAKQLQEGAPYDVFAAANVSFVDQVVGAGACDGTTKALYARGRIVIWTRKDSKGAAPTGVADLADARFVKVAIANPEHAPYGKAAQQALEHAKVWAGVKPKLVFGENVQQTLQFAQTGNADAAIVALSLATVTKDGVTTPIDPSFHAPLDQALVVCRHGHNAAGGKPFADFVNGAEGRAIMRRYGFLLAGEVVAEAAR